MQGCFYTRVLLRRGTFTKACFYTHKHIYTYRCFCRELLYTKPLRTDIFTQRCIDTQKPLYTDTQLLLHRCLHIAMLLHRNAFTHVLLDRVSFGLYVQKLLRPNSLTQRCCLDRNTFIQRRFSKRYFCKDTCAQRCFFTQVLLDQGASRQGLLHG